MPHLTIVPIPAVYYTQKVHNGYLTTNLALVWLLNRNKRTILPTSIPIAYTHTETRLVLTGKPTNCTSAAQAQAVLHRFVLMIKKFSIVQAPGVLKARGP